MSLKFCALGWASFASALVSGAPAALHVSGTQILDNHNNTVVLRGVNAASMEWTSDGEGHILDTLKVAVENWHANIVRLPLAQDRWFGRAPEQKGDFKPYRSLIRRAVDYCSSHNAYIMLDLHWSDAGEWGGVIGQHKMPDENSAAFWNDFARVYRNNPAVLYDLYNEPHNVEWDVWLKGGTVTENDRWSGNKLKTYHTPGMQRLLDVVRGTGARNVVVAGGLDWSYDYSGILDGRQLVDRRGNGVIYANHSYQVKRESIAQWTTRMETACKVLPVIVSEFGANPRASTPSPTWVEETLRVIREHGWSWTAWDLHPAAGPTLITNWSYTPTPTFGVPVMKELAR